MIKHLEGTPKEYAKNLFITLDAVFPYINPYNLKFDLGYRHA